MFLFFSAVPFFLFSFRRMSRRKIRPLWKTMHERPFPKKDLKVISLSSSSFLDVLAQSICFSRWQEPNSSAVELSSDVDRQVPKHAQHRRIPFVFSVILCRLTKIIQQLSTHPF